ncbi:MAG TPA: PEGA domain-containing protein [Polyangiaceae bacterium]|nr:PEGA domain-containing protein [Polyangiaceae bacterium]
MQPQSLRTLVLVPWLAASLGIAGPAAAADASREPTRSLARESFQRGSTAYAQGRFSDAIAAFRAADRLEPSAALVFDMARAYEKIGDDAGALRSYREYLRRAPEAEDVGAVRKRIEALEERLASRGVQQMTVLSDPPGATLLVDGTPVGITPYTLELAPGQHALGLRLAGHANVERSVYLSEHDAVDVSVALPPAAPPIPTPETAHSAPVVGEPPTPRRTSEAGPNGGNPLRTVGIVTTGVGVAALSGALVYELLRRSAEDDAHASRTQVELADHIDEARSRKTAARVLGWVGAGLTVGGAGLWLFSPSAHEKRESGPVLGFGATPTEVSGTVSGRF